MIKKFLLFLVIICFSNISFGETLPVLDKTQTEPTNCATQLFKEALQEDSDEITDNMPENEARVWAQETMLDPSVLIELVDCPEVADKDDLDVINFDPIEFVFPNSDRTLTINYSTQPKILKDKLLLDGKKSIPDGNPNPDIQDESNGAIFMNSEPAWYGILVVQHDSLSQFVGPNKNNVVAVDYIIDNIDDIYPKGYMCTSKSAIATDEDTINRVVRKVVDLEAVGEDDSNDYYVMGDKNLEWIMYAEIVADVVITVVTFGGGAIVSGIAKGARAARVTMKLAKNANKLKKFKNVEKFASISSKIFTTSQKAEKAEKTIKYAKKYEEAVKNMEKFRNTNPKKFAKYEKTANKYLKKSKKIDSKMTSEKLDATKLQKEAEQARKELEWHQKELKRLEDGVAKALPEAQTRLKEAEKAAKAANPEKLKKYQKLEKELSDLQDVVKDEKFIQNKKLPKTIKDRQLEKNKKVQDRIKEVEKELKQMENSGDEVSKYAKSKNVVDELEAPGKYKTTTQNLTEILKYVKNARPHTGNIFARTLKLMKAGLTDAKQIDKAHKVATAGMSSKSAKIKTWLFDRTLKNGSRLARFEANLGLLYGAANFLGEMYDKTSTTSQEYSNGIQFKPFCLLAADDLEGYENVVNYGMWFMWTGSSTDPADDDAAFLEASDFASKFAYALNDFMEDKDNIIMPSGYCNVDIYVVRLILQLDEENVDEEGRPTGKLFYLVMNDVPWTTANAFRKNVQDVKKWEQEQADFEENDPKGKYEDPALNKAVEEYGLDKETNQQQTDEENNLNETTDQQNFDSTNSYNMPAESNISSIGSDNSSTNPIPYVATPSPRTNSARPTKDCQNFLGNASNLIRSATGCNTLNDTEKTRCKKCVSGGISGSYENGHCYIEVLAWNCPKRGWKQNHSWSCSENNKYSECGMIRKYVDVEQPFCCPKQGAISGCCHHGGNHPPLSVENKIVELNCKIPLASNLDWRIPYDNGSDVYVNQQQQFRDWCMPDTKSSHPFSYDTKWKHCAKTIPGGTCLQKWYSIN